MSTTGEGHRPGVFKKPSKPHKAWKGKKTKGQIDDDNRGRLGVRDIVRSRNRSLSKEQRRNQIKQLRANKLKANLELRRKLGGSTAAPPLVTMLSFGSAGSPLEFLNRLGQCDETIIRTESPIAAYFSIPRFKSRIGFLTPDIHVLDNVLDCLKVSDALCLVWPLDGVLSEWEELVVSAIKAHGIPAIQNVASGLTTIPIGKKREEARKGIINLIAKLNLSTDKLMSADTETDGLNIVRGLIEMKKKKLILQKRRAHILVEKVDIKDDQDGMCTMMATGYVRGPAWNVNRLVHIQGWGDYQIDRIEALPDPHPLKQPHTPVTEVKLIAEAKAEKQEDLQSEVVPDPMDAEQTFPDEHDLVEAEKAMLKKKKVVPKGTSSYQAAWIDDGDDDEEEDGDDDDEDEDLSDSDDEMNGDDVDPAEQEESEAEEEHEMIDDTATEASEMMEDMDIDMDEVEKYREERENMQFPDEVDTPIDIPARVRFQKYRGLKSFRTSPWDPLENLPQDYARIFKFQNFKKMKKTIIRGIDEVVEGECAIAGQYVTLHIKRVPTNFTTEWNPSSPLVLYQILPHEQKMSVLNMVIKKHPTCTVPIMNKQKLIFHVGFRKFEAEPVFSQHTNGDKFKMERYMVQDGTCVATVFAPITFPPASVLVFRKDAKGRQELVASGTVLDNNPDRIVLKRIVLAGHPFKINKRSVVCRYMFFNREDIEWFKPVEVYTPRGRRGHIKEPVGTHGFMKAKFDQQLNAQDSIMMSLYKRVFPKWTYNPRVTAMEPSRIAARDAPEESME